MSQERACPKHYQAFYNILQGMSQERASPKNEPVPSIFEGMIGYDKGMSQERACPKHFITFQKAFFPFFGFFFLAPLCATCGILPTTTNPMCYDVLFSLALSAYLVLWPQYASIASSFDFFCLGANQIRELYRVLH